MNKQAKEILKQFQCDYNRMLEETFAQTLTEEEQVRLFYINENRACTNGRNIVVDPAADEMFCDTVGLQNTVNYLGWPDRVVADMWYVLRLMTRAQTIHECLHILYTDFPPKAASDPKCDSKIKAIVMGHIDNIIEDAYIEAVGCSVYDNMEFYLRFGRVTRLFATHPSEGTAAQLLKGVKKQAESIPEAAQKTKAIQHYVEYMATFLLYPMVKLGKPTEEIASYVDQTKKLFLEGSMAPSPAERYEYSSRIFDIILPLIPDIPDDQVEDSMWDGLERLLGGCKTHDPNAITIGTQERKGKTQVVTIRLFTDKDGNPREDGQSLEQVLAALGEFAKDKDIALQIVLYTGYTGVYQGADYDCAVIHKGIKINEIHPKINLNLRKAYQNIFSKYRININSYHGKFLQLLKARVSNRDEKYQFGSGITSTRLGDPQKRYWYRMVDGIDLPDLSILLLIDGSGSMRGSRRDSAMKSAVILHEVLKKQGLQHAIAEHRGHFLEPEIECNVLVDFNAREEEKYNLMQIDANGDNRDGLALFWAERYMNQHSHCETKLIIVLSDGLPAHKYDDYYPPVSTKDTANAVKKIMKRGTNIIAISLDDAGSYECYDQLKEIYPNLVGCNDLNRLTGQLLGLIAKLL